MTKANKVPMALIYIKKMYHFDFNLLQEPVLLNSLKMVTDLFLVVLVQVSVQLESVKLALLYITFAKIETSLEHQL